MRQKFDIIYIDPPYSHNMANIIISDIAEWDLLTENGFAIIEMNKKDEVCRDFLATLGLAIFKQKKYSTAQLVFVERE